MIDTFKTDVKKGLSALPKFLSSKYFYDEAGDALFVKIMEMPEYYLTRAEMEIFTIQTKALIKAFEVEKGSYFELIELGSGDGSKTKKLLKKLVQEDYLFDYCPVDISKHALDHLKMDLKKEIPALRVIPKQGDYLDIMANFKQSKHKKIILFLGSNIGNFSDELAMKFIHQLGSNLKKSDILLLGVDLIKSAEIVLPAYNDKNGITAAFNLNLLKRINKELVANFDLNKYKHTAEYNEEEGVSKSYLVSLEEQEVYINSLKESFYFKPNEKIHTEISRKYNDDVINQIVLNTDFQVKTKIIDAKAYFADYILERF
ncbi:MULTISPECIES: L-histidine N(alpha)-methyltransferase [unclassified Polaribacter]|uniref:L-histidine N(alpha)-methyltransferase n=1 Tax=unclassified Polaribacter TaxID=196858 RepID=UPI0011BD6B15|nr:MULTISPECIES: L-histidine N(alpha)-methyltransferase [unclassified Polaribacter]TXD52001.1 L-histidine N(alpha)-methyltransferase [Polaribacter sp. IC063]TXD58670.1 L-histidine N(alpha)-methyltransferase [Polaribacter sp. IC066]